MSKMHARLIYDGACIFCDAYVRLLSFREAVGPVELIDARSGDPRLRASESAGYDLNEGMLFEYNGTVYFGADAVNVLSTLSTPVSTFNQRRTAIEATCCSFLLSYIQILSDNNLKAQTSSKNFGAKYGQLRSRPIRGLSR